MNLARLAGVVLAVGLGATASLRAQAPADPAADVQQKISAVEKLVVKDERQLQELLPAPAADASPAKPGAVNPPPSRALAYCNVLRQDVLRKDYTNAIAAANNIAGADPNDAVQQAIADLLPDLGKLKQADDAAVIAHVKDLLDRATKLVNTAKAPAEVDGIIAELGLAATEDGAVPRSAERQAAFLQIEDANRFLKQWQEYLIELNAGRLHGAASVLHTLAGMTESFIPVPRSQLLALATADSAAEPQDIDAKVGVHGYDDLPAAISQLQAIQRNGYDEDSSALLNSLQNLRNAHSAFEEKNYPAALQAMQISPFSVPFGNSANTSAAAARSALHKQIVTLKDQLFMEITQAMLAMPDAPPPDKDEHPPDYVLRVAGLKAKAQDWAGLQESLAVYQQITPSIYNARSWLYEDTNALRAYLVGERLEAAGQTLDAIRSYRQSLATLGKFFPADPPTSKLKELATKYPDLYKQALQQPIAKAE